ncbi:breast cancer susceptibility1 isoform X2 [Wolffia australiana]
MAGMDHLERMGRELKCPICLNLLQSAASLSCNHVFCNSCITKSMKSATTCPVCKIPFHRRDIRPSPHMDSLVGIYKNMEVEAGVNLFVSRGESGNGTSIDADHEKEICQLQPEVGEILKETPTVDLLPQVPSFPSKKRVHVAPFSVSETPSKAVEPLFSPFFWMREDADEADDQNSTKSTPQESSIMAPCFSDIKDDDDVRASDQTPTSKSLVGDMRESEIFEWTQRPCSPELWLTPGKNQIKELVQEEQADESPRGKRRLIWKKESSPEKNKKKLEKDGRLVPCKNSRGRKKQKPKIINEVSEEGLVSSNVSKCSFCHLSGDDEVCGEMMHYIEGKPVSIRFNGGGEIIHAHKLCAEWAPNVYFDSGDTAVNLAAEVARSRRIKCSKCGDDGAALGCLERRCRSSFHFHCAKLMPSCRWDQENFVILCPRHASSRLPCESAADGSKRGSTGKLRQRACEVRAGTFQARRWPAGTSPKWVLCCSSLSPEEKEKVSELAKLAGAAMTKNWTPAVTHVIASADVHGACKRTLKFLMAVAAGKWVVNVAWANACLAKNAPVDEEPFEIAQDVHGVNGGPRLGRLRSLHKEPKLFAGIDFFFSGEFSSSYGGYLRDLIKAVGGVVLRRRPASKCTTYVVYNVEAAGKGDTAAVAERRRDEATATAEATGGKAVSSQWILDCIAGCKVLNP